MTDKAEAKPPVVVDLSWTGRLKFTARQNQHEWVLDGRSDAGPSPVAALAAALAGCMAMDVVHILTKGRFHVRAFDARTTGCRADSDPRRFKTFRLEFTIDTDAPVARIERAVALSREKYCSVWHSLRPDIELATSVSLAKTGGTKQEPSR